MPVNDWRSPAVYGHSKHLTAAGFAWEYLRRNVEYRRDYRSAVKVARQNPALDAFPRRWGCDFPQDPDLAPGRAPLFWSPRARPQVIILSPMMNAGVTDRAVPLGKPRSRSLTRSVAGSSRM